MPLSTRGKRSGCNIGMEKNFSFFEIKKYLNKKGVIVKKKKKIETQKSGLDNLSRTFLSSVIIISIFFIAPENDVSFFLIIIFFLTTILQPLLLPQANNDTKDFARLALRSLLNLDSQNSFLAILP